MKMQIRFQNTLDLIPFLLHAPIRYEPPFSPFSLHHIPHMCCFKNPHRLGISLVLLQESYCGWKKGDNMKLEEKWERARLFMRII